MADMQDEIVNLTHKWCEDIKGKDGRVAVGACLNVLTTVGNYSPADVRQATAMFLRKVAAELESRRDQ
jgi:hypothetical protein